MFGSFVAVSISDSCWDSACFPLITCVTLVACVVLQKRASEVWLIPFVFESPEVKVYRFLAEGRKSLISLDLKKSGIKYCTSA